MRLSALVLPLALGACVSGPAPARFAGPAPGCGRIEGGGTTATLDRNGAGFAFAPYDGSLVVNGTVAADGSLSGALPLRPAQAPSETPGAKPPPRAPQNATATGRIAGETATVTYAQPGCTATLTLSRVHPGLL